MENKEDESRKDPRAKNMLSNWGMIFFQLNIVSLAHVICFCTICE